MIDGNIRTHTDSTDSLVTTYGLDGLIPLRLGTVGNDSVLMTESMTSFALDHEMIIPDNDDNT